MQVEDDSKKTVFLENSTDEETFSSDDLENKNEEEMDGKFAK